jgi:hypothetical protein
MSQSNGPIPLHQQVEQITNVPVTTARTNLNTEYKSIEGRLAALTINVHGAILQMLGAAFQVRQEEMKNAISEHQQRAAWEKEQAERKAQAELEKQQDEIAKANRPGLAVVGVQ